MEGKVGEELLAKNAQWLIEHIIVYGQDLIFPIGPDLSELLGRHAAFKILFISACPTKVVESNKNVSNP